jgi:hypothetical protein
LNSDRTTARIVGALFLAGMVAGIVGNVLIQSVFGGPDYLTTIPANSTKVALGALLLLMTVAGDVAHGILLYPILYRHNERIAVGYLGFRIVDAVFLGAQVLFVLVQIPLGNESLKAGVTSALHLQSLSTVFVHASLYSYQIAMVALGTAGLILCYSFYRTSLLARLLAVWGLVGYASMLCGAVLGILGFDLHLIDTIPGGLWELFIGVWLIVKGFKKSPVLS